MFGNFVVVLHAVHACICEQKRVALAFFQLTEAGLQVPAHVYCFDMRVIMFQNRYPACRRRSYRKRLTAFQRQCRIVAYKHIICMLALGKCDYFKCIVEVRLQVLGAMDGNIYAATAGAGLPVLP